MVWAKLLCFLLLLSLHCCSVELTSASFTQTSVELLPCDTEKKFSAVSLNNSILFTVPPDLTYCANETDGHNASVVGFRIFTHIHSDVSAGASSKLKPVVFTARQSNSDGFISWNSPLNHSSKVFPSVSHTMCPVKDFTSQSGEEALPLFYIDAFTSSREPINFTIEVEPVGNFDLSMNHTFAVDVGPASPQIFYFKIPDNVELVTIEASSDEEGCAVVSVQNNTCPVNDLFENARSKGFYQTMSKSAFLTISADSVEDREFLLVLVSMDYSLCYSNQSNGSNDNQRTITITVNEMKPTREYVWAMLLPVVICLVMYVLSIVVCCFYAPRCEPGWIPFHCQNCKPPYCMRIGPCRCICYNGSKSGDNCPGKFTCCRGNPDDYLRTDEETPLLTNETREEGTATGEEGSGQEEGDVEFRPALASPNYGTAQQPGANNQESTTVGGQKSTVNDQKSYHVYSWNTVTVGIFYALPALQLVFSEQKILDQSGDQDTCYYNFKCAHPIWFFSAFNNMWSNIGYILLGFLFVLIVLVRHWQYVVRKNKDNYVDTHGVFQSFGIYYAMGFALILEGFMSSFYHICPSNANFQFDTAFMFITGGIILVKVYQNRHPHVQANAFIAFFTFAVIIFFTLIGIYNDNHHPLSVKISFLFLALVIIFLFLTQFYKWNFNFTPEQKDKIYDRCNCGFHPLDCLTGCCVGTSQLIVAVLHWLFSPTRWKDFWENEKYRVRKHLVIFVVNILIGIVLCIINRRVGIATGVLVFFVCNIIIYLFIYCVIKIYYGEPWTWLVPVFLVLMALSWGAAYHFYGTVTQWSDTPAMSRTLNKECYIEGFYDYHDVWHFLSAFGMFFAFLFVLVIDDGVADIKRTTLTERAV